MTDKEKDI